MIGEIPCACPDCNFRLNYYTEELKKERQLADELIKLWKQQLKIGIVSLEVQSKLFKLIGKREKNDQ